MKELLSMKPFLNQKRISALFILVFFHLLLIGGCKKAPPRIDYLHPLDRKSEGFLDADTFQVIGKAYAFDPALLSSSETLRIPYPVEPGFDQEALEKYNEKEEIQNLKRTPATYEHSSEIESLLLSEVMATDLTALPEQRVDLAAIDPSLEAITKARKTLTENACNQALVMAQYNWFVKTMPLVAPTDTTPKKENLNEEVHDEDNDKSEDNADPLKKDSIPVPLVKGFDNAYFPPTWRYISFHEQLASTIKAKFEKLDITAEMIQLKKPDSETLTCEAVVHIKRDGLIFDHPPEKMKSINKPTPTTEPGK